MDSEKYTAFISLGNPEIYSGEITECCKTANSINLSKNVKIIHCDSFDVDFDPEGNYFVTCSKKLLLLKQIFFDGRLINLFLRENGTYTMECEDFIFDIRENNNCIISSVCLKFYFSNRIIVSANNKDYPLIKVKFNEILDFTFDIPQAVAKYFKVFDVKI
jgi:hypothetical protein